MAVYYKPQSPIQSGEDFIYPITTADQIMKSDKTRRLEQAGLIVADDSTKLGGKAPEYYLQPRNLLDNSDFRNPVNQRGQTTYNAGGYTIDRWSIWSVNGDASLTLIEGGIAFNPGTGNGTFTQKLPLGLLDSAKTYTLAIHKSNGETKVKTDGVTFNHYGNGDLITISAAQETIVWAALYEGIYTAETLPPYVPKGYAAELAACNAAPVDLGGGYGGGSLQAYPVGSIYMSVNSTSPASLFGGTWESISGRFLLGADSTYSAGSTGGEATHTLTVNEMPNHDHASGHGFHNVAAGTDRQVLSNYYLGEDDYSGNKTSYIGGDAAHNNMPPYLAVYMWKRVS